MHHPRLLPAALALLSLHCGPSLAALAERGEFYKACNEQDSGDPKPVIDRLIQRADVRITLTAWSAAEARRAAGIVKPAPPAAPLWSALAVQVSYASRDPALAELVVEAPWLRADGWTSRYAGGVGDNYLLLTGRHMKLPSSGPSVDDVVKWAWETFKGTPGASGMLPSASAPDEHPDDVVDADRLRALLSSSCTASPGTGCRTVALMTPHAESRAAKPAAIALKLRYAVADARSGAHCIMVEHVVVPLAPGADLPGQLAATFAGGSMPLMELRSRARVYKAEGEIPLGEDDRAP